MIIELNRVMTTFRSTMTTHRSLEIVVRLNNIINSNTDVIVNPANKQLQHDAGAARSISRAAGESLCTACNDYIRDHGPLDVATPIFTTAGKLEPLIKAVLHLSLIHISEPTRRT